MTGKEGYEQGGDAKAIAEIAKTKYGGFTGMFEAHDWPERGSDMMCKVQTRVKEDYGSIRAFENCHRGRRRIDWKRGI